VSILLLRLGFFWSANKSSRTSRGWTSSLSQLNPDRNKIFGFSGSNNFQGASGATTSAAHRFKFGALANLQAPPASFTAPYSDEAAYQAYLKRVLDVTYNQGLLKRAPMTSCSTKPSDDASYQQYMQRILEATSNQGLIKHSIPGGRNSREKARSHSPNFLEHKCSKNCILRILTKISIW